MQIYAKNAEVDMLNKYGLPWVVDENPVLVP